MSIQSEILQCFIDAARLHTGQSGDHGNYSPPFQDRLPNGKLGPEYLPPSPITGRPTRMVEAMAQYREGRFIKSEGLWDHEEEARMKGVESVKGKREAARKDAIPMAAYMARAGHKVGKRALEVYVAFWLEGREIASVARHLGVQPSSVRSQIKRLRIKAGCSAAN